jgi:alpha-ribazole phosphatase
MKIVLIRHLALLIEPGICYGRLDVAPDPAAADQAVALLAHPALARVTRVWTSPSRRCRWLAEKIASALPAALMVDPRLRELDFGDWEGRSWDSIDRPALDLWAASPLTFAPPGGESGAALIARVGDFHAALGHGESCIIVSHGGPLKVLAAMLEGAQVDLLAPAPTLGSVRVFHRVK